jgi:hypothetical protein
MKFLIKQSSPVSCHFLSLRVIQCPRHPVLKRSRDSSVGIALGYMLDDRGSIPGRDREFFSSPPRPDRLWGPPGLLSNGYEGEGVLSSGVKRPGREADHSPSSNAEVKNAGSYTSTSPIHVHGMVLS